MVTLTGTFTRLDGTPATGTVRVTPSRSPIMDPDGGVIISGPQTFPLDKDGKIAVTLPATDDPTLGPPFTYTATANMAHTTDTIRNIVLPHTEFEVDLSGAVTTALNPPAGFAGLTALPTPTVVKRGNSITATLDYEHLLPEEGAVYWTSPTAPTGADGLTRDTPVRLATALAKPDVAEIRYLPGEYTREVNVWPAADQQRSIRHIADGPGVTVAGWNKPADTPWTLTSGNIYQTARASTTAIYSKAVLDEQGLYTRLTKKATLEEITGPGQWAIVSSTVYLWPYGDKDMQVPAVRDEYRLQLAGIVVLPVNLPQYAEGITYEATPIVVNNGGTLFAKDCAFRYSHENGLELRGGHAVLDHVTVEGAGRDGFNYHHTTGGDTPEFVEIGCIAQYNGQVDGAETNNASTAHEGVVGVRVGGVYRQSHGPVVADVNESQTWNVDCAVGESTTDRTSQNAAWLAEGTTQMWIEESVAHDAETGIAAWPGSTIWTRNVRLVNVTVGTTGDVQTFI